MEVFLERFSKVEEVVQTETKEVNLREKILETNQMRKKLDNLAKKIKKRVKKHINNDDVI